MCSNNLLITLHLVKEEDFLCYNLIEIIPEVYDIVFSFLDHTSLLNSSLVCQSWNNFIGSSSNLMRKFKFRIKLKDIHESVEATTVINNSKRKIFHLEIDYENNFSGRIKNFWDPERGVLPCPFVENFKKNSFLLKNLLSLNIMTTEVEEISNILSVSVNLKELELKAMRWTETDWLKVTAMPLFKLKSLIIISDSTTASCHEGLHHFLKTQINSLETFKIIKGVLETESINVVLEMKRLKLCEITDTAIGTIKKSGNLKSLEELHAFGKEIENSLLFQSIPNLKKLTLGHLNQLTIQKIGTHLKNLKELHVKSIELEDITNRKLFPSLQLVKVEKFVELHFQELILLQICENPNKFAQCLYDEIGKPPHINWLSN